MADVPPFDKAGNLPDASAAYAFLRQYVGAQASDDDDELDDEPDDDELDDELDDEPDDDELDDEPDDDELDDDKAPTIRQRARKAARIAESVLPTGAVERVANLPTPGGLLPLVLALLVILFAIVPVGAHGETRLGLLWRVITHGASLPPSPKAQVQAQHAAQVRTSLAVVQEAETAAVEAGYDAFWALSSGGASLGGGL